MPPIPPSPLPSSLPRNPGAIPVDGFLQEDRERTIELLLSQERVVTLLYAKTFPLVGRHTGGVPLEGAAGGAAAAAAVDAMAGRPHSTSTGPGPSLLPAIAPRPQTGSDLQ